MKKTTRWMLLVALLAFVSNLFAQGNPSARAQELLAAHRQELRLNFQSTSDLGTASSTFDPTLAILRPNMTKLEWGDQLTIRQRIIVANGIVGPIVFLVTVQSPDGTTESFIPNGICENGVCDAVKAQQNFVVYQETITQRTKQGTYQVSAAMFAGGRLLWEGMTRYDVVEPSIPFDAYPAITSAEIVGSDSTGNKLVRIKGNALPRNFYIWLGGSPASGSFGAQPVQSADGKTAVFAYSATSREPLDVVDIFYDLIESSLPKAIMLP